MHTLYLLMFCQIFINSLTWIIQWYDMDYELIRGFCSASIFGCNLKEIIVFIFILFLIVALYVLNFCCINPLLIGTLVLLIMPNANYCSVRGTEVVYVVYNINMLCVSFCYDLTLKKCILHPILDKPGASIDISLYSPNLKFNSTQRDLVINSKIFQSQLNKWPP